MDTDFQDLFDRYLEIRDSFEAGEIDEEEFQDEIEGLQFKDEEGRFWTIGAQSGKWYYFNGADWVQETPIPMTRHKGRGIPEPVALTVREPEESSFLPRWAFVGCSGILLLGVVGVILILIFGVGPMTPKILRQQGVQVAQEPTPTLESGIPIDTPTPGPTPADTPTPEPSPTELTFKVYANTAFGFSVTYPGDWQAKEGAQQVVLAPDTEGLNGVDLGDNPGIETTAFAVGRQIDAGLVSDSKGVLDQLLAALPADVTSGETGTRTVNDVKWVISQVTLNKGDSEKEMVAYVAATLHGGEAYTVLAAAPQADWNAVAPTFQRMFDSLQFSPTKIETEQPAVALLGTPTMSAGESGEESEAAGPEPDVTPTPQYYVVQSGDTLGGIAIQFEVDVEDLQAANGIDDPAKLSVGQELIIPDENYSSSGSGAVPATPENGATRVASLARSTPRSSSSPTPTAETITSALTETVEITATGEISGTTAEEGEAATPTPAPTVASVAAEDEAPLTGKIIYPVYVPERSLQGQPGSYDLWMSDPQGTNQQVVVYDASQPDLNKGGDLLAYRSWNPDGRGVAFTTVGGGRGGPLTNFVEDGLPNWDPSSLTMIFSSRREGDRVPRIFRVNQANGEEYGLGLIAEYTSVFPNDGRLVYKGCTPEGACGMFVAGPEGTGASFVTNNTGDTAPAVSPDGSKIAFMSINRDGATNYEIFVMDSDGGNLTRLTNNGANDGLPAWSPDGQHIAFVSNRDGVWGIWVMNPDGSNQRKLFNMSGSPDGIIGSEREISKGWLEERISWGP